MRAGNEKIGGHMLLAPVLAGTELTEGTIAVINANGYAEPGKTAAGLISAGCVEIGCSNKGGADGEKTVQIARGIFVWNNDGTIKATDLLKKCYIKDTVTVTMEANGASVAGTILAVETDGIIVDMTAV